MPSLFYPIPDGICWNGILSGKLIGGDVLLQHLPHDGLLLSFGHGVVADGSIIDISSVNMDLRSRSMTAKWYTSNVYVGRIRKNQHSGSTRLASFLAVVAETRKVRQWNEELKCRNNQNPSRTILRSHFCFSVALRWSVWSFKRRKRRFIADACWLKLFRSDATA